MPEPGVDPDVWKNATTGDCEQWQCRVQGLIFIDSVADTKTELPLHVRTFGCDLSRARTSCGFLASGRWLRTKEQRTDSYPISSGMLAAMACVLHAARHSQPDYV